MPTLKFLDLVNIIINQIIGSLVVNSFYKFKPEGSLWPVLLACMASLIMYYQDFMTDMGPTNASSLAFFGAIKTAYIIDSCEATNETSGILNYWGGIISAGFEWKNPDFQPVTNVSNSTQAVTALNHIVTEFSSLQHEPRREFI